MYCIESYCIMVIYKCDIILYCVMYKYAILFCHIILCYLKCVIELYYVYLNCVGSHSGRVVTLSPPTSEIGIRIPARPRV